MTPVFGGTIWMTRRDIIHQIYKLVSRNLKRWDFPGHGTFLLNIQSEKWLTNKTNWMVYL